MTLTTIGKIIAVMLLWAICFPLITIGIEYAPHMGFAAARAVISGFTLIFIAVILGRPFPKDPRVWIILSCIGFGATSLGFFGMFHAAEFVSPGIATVIANTQPLLAGGIGVIVLRERLGLKACIGLIFGFLGILIIAMPKFILGTETNFSIGVFYILMAALGVTASNVLIRKIASQVDPFMAMGFQLLIGSVPLIIYAAATDELFSLRWTMEFTITLLTLSLLGTSLAYWIWMSVLKTVPLYRANTYSFLVPVFGILIGMLFFQELLTPYDLIGIAIAISGVVLVSTRSTDP